jgi:uncharacterized protein YegL
MPADKVTRASPWHVVFIIDDSGSMGPSENQKGPTPAEKVSNGLRDMLTEMVVIAKGSLPYFKVSLISFGSAADILAEAKSEKDVDIEKIVNFAGNSGSTRPSEAFRSAIEILKRNPGKATDFRPYVFFFSDGVPDDDDTTAALEAAAELKSLKIDAGEPTIWALGFGAIDAKFMKRIASAEKFKEVQDVDKLARLFPVIGTLAGTTSGEAAIDQGIMNY